ncbi:hypothetical protein OAS86_00870 [Gammaproteobacteria bacterium]|nr:hypothetical protein [Gammaproteobacteria bacterium]
MKRSLVLVGLLVALNAVLFFMGGVGLFGEAEQAIDRQPSEVVSPERIRVLSGGQLSAAGEVEADFESSVTTVDSGPKPVEDLAIEASASLPAQVEKSAKPVAAKPASPARAEKPTASPEADRSTVLITPDTDAPSSGNANDAPQRAKGAAEIGALGSEAERSVAVTRRRTTLIVPESPRCVSVGPFTDAQVGTIRGIASGAGVAIREQRLQTRIAPLFRVFQGPFDNRDKANMQAKLLERSAIDHYVFIDSDDQSIHISFGIFSVLDGAQQVSRDLIDKGVNARIREETEQFGPGTWVEFAHDDYGTSLRKAVAKVKTAPRSLLTDCQ